MKSISLGGQFISKCEAVYTKCIWKVTLAKSKAIETIEKRQFLIPYQEEHIDALLDHWLQCRFTISGMGGTILIRAERKENMAIWTLVHPENWGVEGLKEIVEEVYNE